ncbi:MAG: diaminopimelate epimerase [Armatimonadetes bacterium]|nr:diaminopimelate epimerase [Armatimonadota bacterium]
MQKLEFVKMHGIGNDFVLADFVTNGIPDIDLKDLAIRICDRNFGVGADGLLLVLPSEIADYRMHLINRDGSEAEMCGNGIRVFAKYLYDRGMVGETAKIETLAGIKTIQLEVKNGKAIGATVGMGKPRLRAEDIPVIGYEGEVVNRQLDVEGESLQITCVSMGNPHCVIFVQSTDRVPVETLGPKIEKHPVFPQGTNVEFVEVIAPTELKMRVWERGAGMTMACGTGACSSVVAGVLNGLCERQATVHLPGGNLFIDWQENDEIFMTGPAEEVFVGKYMY